MKSVLVYFILLFSTAFTAFSAGKGFSVLQTSTRYTYNVGLEEQYRSKDILEMISGDLSITHRYITATGFQFSSADHYTKAHIEQVFADHGILSVTVTESKETAAVFETEKAGGNNCEASQILCSNTSQTANSSGPGIQELTTANKGCLGVEHQSSWYYINVQNAGSLSMIINPSNTANDYDFAIWGPFTAATAGANCPPVSAPIRCSYSAVTGQTGMMVPFTGQTSSFGCGFFGFSPCTGLITTTNNPPDVTEGTGGDSWVSNLTVTANQVYILLVDNFSNTGDPYAMSFGGSAVLGCTPVVLPVELSDFKGQRINNGNLLRWTTQSENNSDRFVVEWTTDPLNGKWEAIGKVEAAKQSEVETDYALAHTSPDKRSLNYYRLMQVDLDGFEHVYNDRILALDNSNEAAQLIRIVNLMGQEVDETAKGLVIYQFSDGTTMKVVQ